MNLQKQQVAWQFSRSANTYDSVSEMQREMAGRLLQFLPINAQGTLIDLGCGTGNTLATLAKRKGLQLIGVDIAAGMISQAATKLHLQKNIKLYVADLESTRLPNQTANFIFSNAAMQWCDPEKSIKEISRLMCPGGRLMFSTFGPETLDQIRQAWQRIGDDHQPVHPFESDRSWGRVLERLGFIQVQFERKIYTTYYDTAIQLLTSIKRLGATDAQSKRRQGLLSREKFKRFCNALTESRIGSQQLPLTFEQLFFVADLADCTG